MNSTAFWPAVVHQLVGPIEHSRSAKDGRFAVDSGGIHDSGPAKRSPHERYGFSANHIVDHLVGVDDSHQVGPALSFNGYSEHPVIGVEVDSFGGRDNQRTGQVGAIVRPYPASEHLRQVDGRVFQSRSQELEEPGVQASH